jgi:hypothetical protein
VFSEERTDERDQLKQVQELVTQIQAYRKELDLAPAAYDEGELTSTGAIADLSEERDTLQAVVPLVIEIHDLSRHLQYPVRVFDESEVHTHTRTHTQIQ